MWHVILANIIPLLFAVVTPPIMVVVGGLLRKLATQWHLQNLLTYENKIDDLVLKGIQAVEQKSLAAVQKGGSPTPNEQKLADVMKFVNAQLDALGLPEKAASELSMLVEAALFGGAKVQPAPPMEPAPAPANPAQKAA